MAWLHDLQYKSSLNRGYNLLKQESYHPAAIAFRFALDRRPNDPRALEGMGIALGMQGGGLLEKGLTFLNQAIDHTGPNERLLFYKILFLNHLDRKAEALFNATLYETPDCMNVKFLFMKAMVLKDNNRYLEALEALDRWEALAGPNPQTVQLKSDLMVKTERLELAIELLREGVAKWPNQQVLRNDLGFYLVEHAQEAPEMEEAVMHLDQAHRLAPKWAEPLSHRGFAYVKMGDLGKARTDLEESQTLDPDSPYLYRNWAHLHLEEQAIDLAREAMLKALELGFSERYGSEVEGMLRNLKKEN
ncbi:hypothetical protein [Pontibacter sp. G13]|uniref:hypothetical protein n=1 Tax=Pontibacter sp. G13 TaxID=3074898 RepID=UPI002889CDDD|nr:hypothetical protein [Pontibacter sp. G13]WNJ20117.1 hypothetical protein RJD25_06500 [Pontibacter sp. G13]